MLGRRNSVATRNPKGSHRDSISADNHPSSDRILSWRQSISSNSGSHVNIQTSPRPTSPHKSLSHAFQSSSPNPNRSPKPTNRLQSSSTTPHSISAPSLSRSSNDSKIPPSTSVEQESRKPFSTLQPSSPDTDPLMLQGDHSYMFWNKQPYQSQVLSSSAVIGNQRLQPAGGGDGSRGSTSSHSGGSGNHLGLPATRESTTISALSSDAGSDDGENGEAVRCRRCDGRTFRARGGKGKTRLECQVCGEVV